MDSNLVYAHQGDTLESLCFTAFGDARGYLEACLKLNPHLVKTIYLAPGTPVRLPRHQQDVLRPRSIPRVGGLSL